MCPNKESPDSKAQELAAQLSALPAQGNVLDQMTRLCDSWMQRGVGPEAIEPVLRFIEDHPSLDYGSPGPLVHFVERFYGPQYVELLVRSIARRPVEHTIWMLNRVINGALDGPTRRRLIQVMKDAARHPLANSRTIASAQSFLSRLEPPS